MTEPAASRARAAKPFGLPSASRVLATREFKRIYAQGSRARGELLTVVGRRRRDELVRLGLSVSKDHGPAVRRNKIKRILREAFRLERPGLPRGWDLVLIPVVRKQKLRLSAARSEIVRLARDLAEGKRQPNRPR